MCKGTVESKGLFTLIKSEAKMPVKATMSIKMHVVITILYHSCGRVPKLIFCQRENDSALKAASIFTSMPLWFKLMGIHISTEHV